MFPIVFLFIFIFSILIGHLRVADAAALANQNGITTKWPSNIISVKYPQTYSPAEAAMLQGAAQQISIDLGYCVNFTNYVPGSGQPFIFVQPAPTPGPAVICKVFPGYNPKGGVYGQVNIMFGTASGNAIGGCLDNKRDAMRFWANSLGLLNEYQRSDRDPFLIFPSNRNSLVAPTLQSLNIFSDSNKLNSSTATLIPPNNMYTTPFDLNSITMITGQRYAASSNQPVFTLANSQTVGQTAHLSAYDCAALKMLYGCQEPGYGPSPTCSSLTTANTNGITLNPSPAILTRTLQCSSTVPTTLTSPMTLGFFWLTGIDPATIPDPTISLSFSISGVTVELAKLNSFSSIPSPDPISATGVTENCVPSPQQVCVFAVKFKLTTQPLQGLSNQQVTVNLQVKYPGSNSVSTVSLPITINLNCAPIFNSVTAAEGYGAALVTQRTLALSTGGITVQNPPSSTNAQIGATAATNVILSKYIVNYNAQPFGQSGGNLIPPFNKKVFVNCVGSDFGGTTTIGIVSATDPDGGPVRFYSYSGSQMVSPDVITAAQGEKVDVTMDGVITISALAATNTVNPAPSPDNGATDSAISVDEILPREYFIVAVDSLGAKSVLRLQYYFQCGPTVT